MGRLLLCYDTKDRDLARDVESLMEELGVETEMIPRAPDGGLTLQGKEEKYFEEVEGVMFLVTPGSMRDGKQYPSPSVADEMGQAKQKFKEEPWRVIYLVDRDCTLQTIDQRAYIDFDRGDARSVIEAIRRLCAALKDARLLSMRPEAPAPAPPSVNLTESVEKTPQHLLDLCMALAIRPGGGMWFTDFQQLAAEKLGNAVDGNLAVRDLFGHGLIELGKPVAPNQISAVFPTQLGWDFVRILRAQARNRQAAARRLIAANRAKGPDGLR